MFYPVGTFNHLHEVNTIELNILHDPTLYQLPLIGIVQSLHI